MTMLLAQHGIMGNVSGGLVPTDKTKVYTSITTMDETRYYLNSLLHQNPKAKNTIIHTFGDGVSHTTDAAKKISYRINNTRGVGAWGTKQTLYDPTDSTFQIQDPGIGMDTRGRLHILADCHTGGIGTPGGTHELRYMYSDDNGATVSSPVVISAPSTSLATFRMYGRVIDTGGGVLMAPSYWLTEEGDSSQSERWVLRSTDYGANWTWILVEGPTSEYRNESELIAITSNVIFMVSRNEAITGTYYMYKSVDAGLTWVAIGVLGTGVTNTIPGPCRLHKFRADNGKWWVVMYFPDKDSQDLYAMYGRLDNGVEGGVGLFNQATVTLMYNDTKQLHYGDFVHYNGNLNARGAWPRENYTTPLVDNEIVYFENISTHYDTVFALIDPITIYDKLGALMGVYTSRGMVSNTDNDYGVVNASSQITTLKSIRPGPTSQNFTATAGGILLNAGAMDFDGTKALTHGTSTYWQFLTFSSAGYTDVNYTIHMKVKLGIASDPNALYGLFGDSGGTPTNRGASLFYDDRVSQSRNDAIRLMITTGAGVYTLDWANNNVITPNAWHVIRIEVDLSQSTTNNKVKLYVDGSNVSTVVTTFATTVNGSPTYNMQIGNIGNNLASGYLVGSWKDLVFQNVIDLPSVYANFTQALIDAV